MQQALNAPGKAPVLILRTNRQRYPEKTRPAHKMESSPSLQCVQALLGAQRISAPAEGWPSSVEFCSLVSDFRSPRVKQHHPGTCPWPDCRCPLSIKLMEVAGGRAAGPAHAPPRPRPSAALAVRGWAGHAGAAPCHWPVPAGKAGAGPAAPWLCCHSAAARGHGQDGGGVGSGAETP